MTCNRERFVRRRMRFRLYRYEIYTRVWCMVDEWLMDDLVDRGRMDWWMVGWMDWEMGGLVDGLEEG